MNQATNVLNSNDTNNANRGRRKKLFTLLALSVALIGGGGWAYWELVGSHHISTDDAYTGVESAELTPSVTGTIAEVRATDTQSVKKGDVLVVIDPADAKL